LARGVCALLSPFPLSSEAEERGIKTGAALPRVALSDSLTRGYNHVTPNGVSVWRGGAQKAGHVSAVAATRSESA